MKRRSLTVLLCLLAIISLASVGFASWVISADDTEEVEGNIQVETVTDQRVTIFDIKLSGVDGKGWLYFTGPKDATSGWLTATGSPEASLEATLTFKVKVGSLDGIHTEKDKNVDLTLDWDDNTKAVLKAAFEKKFISEIPDLDSATNLTYNSKTNTYSVTIKFAWGSAFGGKNPFDFYNSKKVNDGYYTDKEGNIQYIKETSGDTVTYTDAQGTSATPTEETLKDLTFVSWGDDANAKLNSLYSTFGGTDSNKGEVTYKIIITAKYHNASN